MPKMKYQLEKDALYIPAIHSVEGCYSFVPTENVNLTIYIYS